MINLSRTQVRALLAIGLETDLHSGHKKSDFGDSSASDPSMDQRQAAKPCVRIGSGVPTVQDPIGISATLAHFMAKYGPAANFDTIQEENL